MSALREGERREHPARPGPANQCQAGGHADRGRERRQVAPKAAWETAAAGAAGDDDRDAGHRTQDRGPGTRGYRLGQEDPAEQGGGERRGADDDQGIGDRSVGEGDDEQDRPGGQEQAHPEAGHAGGAELGRHVATVPERQKSAEGERDQGAAPEDHGPLVDRDHAHQQRVGADQQHPRPGHQHALHMVRQTLHSIDCLP